MTDIDYSQLPEDQDELFRRIRTEYAVLERAYRQASEAQMSVPDRGGWSIKDNLAHLAGWLRFMRLCYLHGQPPYQAFGLDQATFERLDETGLNAVLFERNKDRPLAEVLADLQEEYGRALAELERTPFADLMRPLPGDPENRPLILWISNNTYEHFQEHRITIEKLLEQRRR